MSSAFEAIMAQQHDVEAYELVMSGTNSKHQKAIKDVKASREILKKMLHSYANDLPYEDTELGNAAKGKKRDED